MDIATLFNKKYIKQIMLICINIIFWILILTFILINFYAAGSLFKYETNHDHHIAFFAYLSAMATNGIFPGIDFYSPHSIFIPIIVGIFFKLFGISQINLGLVDGIIVFIGLFSIYKTARFVMPNIFAKLSILILLLSHSGRDNPWFNDIIMTFVAIAIYFFASYINKNKRYKLIIIGFICFMLPYMRQQGIVISAMFILLPMIIYYCNAINKQEYVKIIQTILKTFVISNLIFFIFIFIRNGLQGLEILFSSIFTLVDMAQPAIAYYNKPIQIIDSILNYTSNGYDWHGYFMRFLSYWFIVIIPAIYFIYNFLSKRKNDISKLDTIRFITAVITLSTIVFNYPINEDARMRVQFGLGIWLFIDVLILCFYNKKTKILSISTITIIILLINHSKITQFIKKFNDNYQSIVEIKKDYQKMPIDTPYSRMKFKADYANNLNNLIYKLREYQNNNPKKSIIFDGEIVEINEFILLMFDSKNAALQHKFPYYYGAFNRKEFYTDINKDFKKFIDKNKPIVIGCSSIIDITGYTTLVNINDFCNIYIPQEG